MPCRWAVLVATINPILIGGGHRFYVYFMYGLRRCDAGEGKGKTDCLLELGLLPEETRMERCVSCCLLDNNKYIVHNEWLVFFMSI